MMQAGSGQLGCCNWCTNDVDDRGFFGLSACDGIDSRKLANAESGDDRTNTLNPGIAIGSISYALSDQG